MKTSETTIQRVLILVNAKDERDYSFAFAKMLKQSEKTCEVRVLGFGEELPFYTQFPSTERRDKLQHLLIEDEKELITKHCKKYFDSVCQIDIQTGNSLMNAIEYIDEYKPDIVIKNEDHMDKAFTKHATSGFDLKLARYCPAPILLMDSDLTKKTGVGCAIAPEPDDDNANELCEKILRFGSFFANKLDSEMFAIRSWTVFGEQVLRSRGRMSEEQMKEHIESIRLPTRQIFDRVIGKFRKQTRNTIHADFHKGDPSLVIYQTAVERELGLLIIGSVARSGLQGYVIGNTAEEIVQSATCSVLIVKPDDFKGFKSYIDG